MKKFIIVDEFGFDITMRVDCSFYDGGFHVKNELGIDITSVVEFKMVDCK